MHLPCRTVLHCCSSLGKGKGDSEEEHTEAAVARLPWILPSARAGMATDQPAQQGMLVEQSRLSPLRPRSQFVFLAACGTRPSCSRWRAASTRTLELLRCLAASKRPAAPCMVMGRMSAVGGVQRSEAQILGPKAGGTLQQRTTKVRLLQILPTRRKCGPCCLHESADEIGSRDASWAHATHKISTQDRTHASRDSGCTVL